MKLIRHLRNTGFWAPLLAVAYCALIYSAGRHQLLGGAVGEVLAWSMFVALAAGVMYVTYFAPHARQVVALQQRARARGGSS